LSEPLCLRVLPHEVAVVVESVLVSEEPARLGDEVSADAFDVFGHQLLPEHQVVLRGDLQRKNVGDEKEAVAEIEREREGREKEREKERERLVGERMGREF